MRALPLHGREKFAEGPRTIGEEAGVAKVEVVVAAARNHVVAGHLAMHFLGQTEFPMNASTE